MIRKPQFVSRAGRESVSVLCALMISAAAQAQVEPGDARNDDGYDGGLSAVARQGPGADAGADAGAEAAVASGQDEASAAPQGHGSAAPQDDGSAAPQGDGSAAAQGQAVAAGQSEPSSASRREASAEDQDAAAAAEPADTAAAGGEEADTAPPQNERVLETVVVGTSEAKTSGALHILKAEKLQRFEYDDPQAVLKLVPGVYARGEDGFGLRPNIGLRGANSDRSKKVTLLEDGVLFGPAPYSAPAAYYFPLMTRMQTVRVLKGPAAIVHGPQTVGGSIELLTRDIPFGSDFGLDVAGGQYLGGKLHSFFGASNERSGFLIEGVHLRSGGFKQLDGGGGTGFFRNEWMAKAEHRLDAFGDFRQSLHLKLGYSDENSNETYLGLSDADFRENPLRRYAASALDQMQWHRTQVVLSHRAESDRLAITTTAYRHDFDRSWRKLNRFEGSPVGNVLADPESARNSLYYGVLTGAADTSSFPEQLLIGPNHRIFVSQGVQSVARWSAATGPVRHSAEVGARFHYDSIERTHTENAFLVEDGRLVSANRPTSLTADNKDSTHALALHAVDAMAWGPLTLTPGLRLEWIQSLAQNALTDTRDEGGLVVLLPGVGAHAAITKQLGVFAGVNRGFSPPPPGSAATTGPEESINYEAGARWTRRSERLELVGFFNDYSNLTDICTFSNGCLNDDLDRQFDAGRAQIVGLEAFAERTFRPVRGLRLPVSLAYTFTQTALLEDFQSADPQFGNVRAGDELPYVPRHQGFASLGAEAGKWGAYFNATWVGTMREQAGQGETDARELTDELLTFDAGASWYFLRDAELYVNARNLFNTLGIVSRRPYGARPNPPRTVFVGFKYSM